MAVAGYLTACNVENKVAGSVNQVMQGNSASYRTDGVLTIDEYAKKYNISKKELKLLKEYEKSEQNITTANLFSQAIALTMAGNQFAKWEKAGGEGTSNTTKAQKLIEHNGKLDSSDYVNQDLGFEQNTTTTKRIEEIKSTIVDKNGNLTVKKSTSKA